MDFYEFNRRVLSALNRYPKESRLRTLRYTANYTRHYGYQQAVDILLPALEKGGELCQDAGEQRPAPGHTAFSF